MPFGGFVRTVKRRTVSGEIAFARPSLLSLNNFKIRLRVYLFYFFHFKNIVSYSKRFTDVRYEFRAPNKRLCSFYSLHCSLPRSHRLLFRKHSGKMLRASKNLLGSVGGKVSIAFSGNPNSKSFQKRKLLAFLYRSSSF